MNDPGLAVFVLLAHVESSVVEAKNVDTSVGIVRVHSKKPGLSVIKDVLDGGLGLLITRNMSKTNSLEICGLLEKMEDRSGRLRIIGIGSNELNEPTICTNLKKEACNDLGSGKVKLLCVEDRQSFAVNILTGA